MKPESHRRHAMCSVSAAASSIMTMMACWIFLSPMGTCTRKWSRPRRVRTTNSSIHCFTTIGGKFVEVSKISGDGFLTPHPGRGAAFADYDNDGFVDVVAAN